MESSLDAAAAAAAAAVTRADRTGPRGNGGRQASQHASQPPLSEANVLDALFHTDSFSTAAQTAGQQRDNPVTPLMAQMLLSHYLSSLANNAGHQVHNDQAGLLSRPGSNSSASRRPPAHETTPIQTTRSGRISRPPVQPPSQNLLAELQGKIGMGPILEALATTGLITGGFAGGGGRQPAPPTAPQGALAQFAATVDNMARSQQDTSLSFMDDQAGFERDHTAAGPSTGRNARVGGHHQSTEASSSKRVRIGHVDRYDDSASDHAGLDGYGSSESGHPKRQRRDRGIPQEEVDRRRKERNRKAAQNSRKRKQLAMRSQDSRMAELEEKVQFYEARVEQLERELQRERQRREQLESAGTSAIASPPSLDTGSLAPSVLGQNDIPPFDPNMTFDPNFFNNIPSGFDFDNLLNFAADDDDDLDFVPNTSPQDEASDDDDDDEEETPRPGTSRPDATPRDEVFEENLFLPIEDVQIPPDHVVAHAWEGRDGDTTNGAGWGGTVSMDDLRQEMMRSLNVHTTEQFRVAMERLLESAGDGGIAPEVKDQLRRLISSIKEQEEQDRA